MRRIIFILLFVSSALPVAHAQELAGSDKRALSFGLGLAQAPAGLSASLSYNFERDGIPLQVGLDYAGASNFLGRGPEFFSASLTASSGLRQEGRRYRAVQYIGASLSYHQEKSVICPFWGPCVGSTGRDFTPGVAAAAQFYLKPMVRRLPGVGMEVFGNLNWLRSYYGLRVSFLLRGPM